MPKFLESLGILGILGFPDRSRPHDSGPFPARDSGSLTLGSMLGSWVAQAGRHRRDVWRRR